MTHWRGTVVDYIDWLIGNWETITISDECDAPTIQSPCLSNVQIFEIQLKLIVNKRDEAATIVV